MCANPNKAATEEFRNRKGPQRGYKVVYKRTARPQVFDGRPAYHPGCNVDRYAVKTYLGYKRGTERGFHCYATLQGALESRADAWAKRELTVVCVTFDPSDVIAAEVSHWSSGERRTRQQIVVRALHISDRAWKQAKLPKPEGCKR